MPDMMHRTQILLPEQLLDWLRKEAENDGTSVSEVIRAIVKKYRADNNEDSDG